MIHEIVFSNIMNHNMQITLITGYKNTFVPYPPLHKKLLYAMLMSSKYFLLNVML